jgi:two-component system response regulator NreC
MSIRLAVADDHGILRAGLVALLNSEPEMEVIGEASDEAGAVALAVQKCPDVILMDISMPDGGGIEATRRIHELAPDVRVLIMTVHEDKSLMQEAIRCGALGYILKKAIGSELINAIHTVMRDQLYLHPSMARLLLMEKSDTVPLPSETLPEPLTQREIEVLRLIAHGYTNGQAAEMLSISVRTVEYHRSNLIAKLHLHSRVELMRYAEKQGLI